MAAEALRCEVSPKVVRAGVPARLRIRPVEGGSRLTAGSCRITVTPTEGLPADRSTADPRSFDVAPRDGVLESEITLPAEQEYVIQPGTLPELRVYALDRDLFERLPWKADLHIHSVRSDGADEPAHVPVACRRIGMDLMSLTDHRLYEPSLEALRAFAGCPTGLTILPGEEVHPPDTETHLVHVGGSESINALFDAAEYREAVSTIAASLPRNDRELASCLWCFDRIRRAGGIDILAHPYWFTRRAYNVPEGLLASLFERQPFDALELIGGYYPFQAESNVLQVARWQEERARGRRIPVVGASDAHGCEKGELFGWYWTVFFASEPSLAGLREALAGEWSVAVEARPGEAVRAFGPFRLVKYAHFLMREVFPAHDSLCAAEAAGMAAWRDGDRSAAGRIAKRRDAVRALYRELWQR